MNQLYLTSSELILVGPILQNSLKISQIPQVAIDGGIQFANAPVLWVGDGDSSEVSQHITLLKKTSQDESDFSFCLKVIADGIWTKLHLMGFLGKRKDHELANLGEVAHHLKSRTLTSEVIFYDQDFKPQIHFFQTGTASVRINGLFSVLVFERAVVSISGACEFQATKISLDFLSSRGVSNLGSGVVEIQSTTPFMIVLESDRLA